MNTTNTGGYVFTSPPTATPNSTGGITVPNITTYSSEKAPSVMAGLLDNLNSLVSRMYDLHQKTSYCLIHLGVPILEHPSIEDKEIVNPSISAILRTYISELNTLITKMELDCGALNDFI